MAVGIEINIELTESGNGTWREHSQPDREINGVDGFTEEYSFLSNDFPHPMTYQGTVHPNAEAALQAICWDGKDEDVLGDVLRAKFSNPELKGQLLSTHDTPIVTKKLHVERCQSGAVINRYVGSPLGDCLMHLRDELIIERAGPLDSLLDAVIPSAEVREYLKTQKLPMGMIRGIIGGAPVPMREKIKWLRTYAPSVADIMQGALGGLALKPGERLRMTEFCFDAQRNEVDRECGAFSTYEAVLERIRKDAEETDTAFWTMLDKEIPDGNGGYKITYTYFLAEDEVIFFYKDYEDRMAEWYENSSILHINLPFQPGDIVSYDSMPFAYQKNAVLLKKGRKHGGDNISCLYRDDKDGTWNLGNMRLNNCWGLLYQPPLSLEYRLHTHQGELPKEEQLMKTIHDYIAGDGEKGARLYQKLLQQKAISFTDEEVLALMD